MNRVIPWFVHNPVAANLLMVLFLAGGIVAITQVAFRTFPDIELDVVTVQVTYLGAGPEETELGVCSRIEEAVDGIDDIERITSSSTEGACAVTVELISGADARVALDEVKNRVDAIQGLPEETEQPIVSQPATRRSVIDVAVSGSMSERARKELGEQLRDEIARLPGITQVELRNVRPYEISIEVPEAALRRHGLRFDDVVASVRQWSLDLPGGSIKTAGGEILLRSQGQAYRGGEFERVVLMARPDGTRVTLGDVATVVDGFEDLDQSSVFDGKPASVVRVFRVADQDTLEISRDVRAFVAQRAQTLPPGVELTVWRDSSEQLASRLDVLLRNGRSGFLLVFGLLALFMRLRLAIWVAVGVPVSFAGALWLFPVLGVSIDMISLFAFILVLGILVDDAVVVGESVHTHQERLGDPVQGAIEGTQAVAVPVIFGVLTTIVAFAPLLFLPGRMGQMIAGIAFVVILCLVFSLIESQLILPAHVAHGVVASRESARRGRWSRIQQACADALDRFIEQRYRPFLERSIDWRYTTLATAIAVFIVTLGLLASGRLPFAFFPPIEGDYITAQLTMPAGTPVEQTELSIGQVAAALDDVRAEIDAEFAREGESVFEHTLVSVGSQPFASEGTGRGLQPIGTRGSGSHLAEIAVELIPGEQRDISTKEVAARWRARAGAVPDAVELAFSSDLFSLGSDIFVQLQGPDVDQLRTAADRLKAALAAYPGVHDIADSFRGGKEEVKLEVLASAASLGVTLQDLARQVRQAFYGEEAQRVQRGRDEVRVMVRYPYAERRSLGDLEDMRIRTDDGSEVPFTSVARAVRGRGYSTIRRADRRRVVNVTARVDQGVATSSQVMQSLETGALAEILSDYPGISYSLQGALREQARTTGGLAAWFLMALFGIYALLAVPLRSYTQPLIVMAVIPFGLCGAIAGHLIMGVGYTGFLSALGIVALSGVVVNASLVLVHAVNRFRDLGSDVSDAVRQAAMLRFRPIFLTALTTFVGLLPLMLERSTQAQFLIPMAVSLAFGVLFSSFLTLLLVPALYLILEDLNHGWRSVRGGEERSFHTTRAPSSSPTKAA